MTMSFTNKATEKNSIVIQSVDNKISSTTLSESAKIISNRLKDFGIDKTEVTVVPADNQIKIVGINDSDMITVKNLITQKGRIEFYRAYNHSELLELLQGDNQLFSFFNERKVYGSDTRIGCISLSEKGKVNEYLNTTGHNKKCLYVWSNLSDSSEVCLYALRLEHSKGYLLAGNDLDSVKVNRDKLSKYWYIDFTFKKPVVKVWSDITKQNIGNSIAIVVDDHVICAPVINSTIESGKCSITGNFTEHEVKLFAAYGNYGELPVSFYVVK